MKFHRAVLLAVCLGATPVAAFLSNNPHHHAAAAAGVCPSSTSTAMPMSMATKDEVVDVSIPYDAAARLAYDEWRAKYGKGDFDDARWPVFKANYEAISVANVAAKAQAREDGAEEAPSLLTLNEYGDCTEDEYRKAMESAAAAPAAPTTTGDVLGKALDAAQSQSEASSALKDAADALAEEEEVSQRIST